MNFNKNRIKNLHFKSKIKNFKKFIYKNLNKFNIEKFLLYYKLFFKNIDKIYCNNIFKKKKCSRLKKKMSRNIKNILFF